MSRPPVAAACARLRLIRVMAGLAVWLMQRRVARIALITLLFPLPLLAVVSAAIVVMATIAQGWRIAMQDCAVASLALMVLIGAAGGFWTQIGAGALVTWFAAIALGELRRAGSLTLAVQCTVLLGVLGALIFTLWSQDPQAYWEQVLRDWTERARSAGIEVGPGDLIPGAAPVMTGMMSASAVTSAIAALFLGCWWAGMVNGRGFGGEFQLLRMGGVLGLTAGITGLLFLTSSRSTVDDLLLVLAAGFVVQGLAVIHWHGARRGWPTAWPVALYLPLAVLPRLAAVEMILLALLGLLDNGYSLRRIGSKVV